MAKIFDKIQKNPIFGPFWRKKLVQQNVTVTHNFTLDFNTIPSFRKKLMSQFSKKTTTDRTDGQTLFYRIGPTVVVALKKNQDYLSRKTLNN